MYTEQKLQPVGLAERAEPQTLNPKVLSSLIASMKVKEKKNSLYPPISDPHIRMRELLNSKAAQALLSAAEDLSLENGLSQEESLKLILSTLKEIDNLWEQVLIEEGIHSLNCGN